MVEHTFSDEAEFIYSLLLEHYDNGEIDDPSVLIESEEYKHTINIPGLISEVELKTPV